METTAQLIAAFDNQQGRRSHGQRIRSSHQGTLTAQDLKRKLTLIGIAAAVTLVGSLFLVF